MDQGEYYLMRNWCRTGDGDPTNGYGQICEVLPKHALCKGCRVLKLDWHPKPPPAVRFAMFEEAPDAGIDALPVVHNEVYEVLRSHCAGLLATPCANDPFRGRRLATSYVALSFPRVQFCDVRNVSGVPWPCPKCNRWHFSGRGAVNYIYLRPEQFGLSFLFDYHSNLLASLDIREKIDRVAKTEIRWTAIPVRGEPLASHRIPSDGLGPPAPSPFPEPVMPPKRRRGTEGGSASGQ